MAADQARVEVSRISTITPAIPTVKHRMFLSGFDLGLVGLNNMQYLLFYKPITVSTMEKEFSMIVANLKRSLSLALVDFYPFAGRLDLNGGESNRPEIDCNDGGVDFVEASVNMAFQDVENNDFQHQNFFNELVPTLNQNHDAPLMSVQVSAFLGGGICIGIRYNHAMADGNSIWHFMRCWAEHSKGLPISKKPHHMRTALKRDIDSYAIPNVSFTTKQVLTDLSKEAYISSFTRADLLPVKYSGNTGSDLSKEAYISSFTRADLLPVKYSGNTGSASKKDSDNISTMKEETKLEISTFHFSETLIKSLKERSGALSSFVAIAAQFWRCIIKARQVPENEPVEFVVVAECRGRVKPPLSPTYFGNCMTYGYARATAKELWNQDIRFAARLIQEAINSCITEEYINNMIDWYESELSCRGHVNLEKLCGTRYFVPAFNSPKLPVYEIDHGWGRPLNVQEVFMSTSKVIGGLMLFTGTEGRSIVVSTQLPHSQMEILKQILMIIPDSPHEDRPRLNIRSSI